MSRTFGFYSGKGLTSRSETIQSRKVEQRGRLFVATKGHVVNFILHSLIVEWSMPSNNRTTVQPYNRTTVQPDHVSFSDGIDFFLGDLSRL